MFKNDLGKKKALYFNSENPETRAKAGKRQLQNTCLEDRHTNEWEGANNGDSLEPTEQCFLYTEIFTKS